MKLSIVTPCFNEEKTVGEFHRRVTKVCTDFSRAQGLDYEIILVNDGSRDKTWALIEGYCETDPHLVGVNLARNYGFQSALAAGLAERRGERGLGLDADLQDPPEMLPHPLGPLTKKKNQDG